MKHSRHIEREFARHGVAIEHLDARTPNDERAATLARLRSGETQVVTNCMILTEGFDYPGAGCIVIARPTKSRGLYLQMAGRGVRPHPGKENCILIDHSGCIANHGFIDEPVKWTLDGKKQAWSRLGKMRAEKCILTCEMCRAAFNGPRCPYCGTEVENYGRKIATLQADLVQVGKGAKRKPTMDEKRRFYGMLEHFRIQKGYQPGWTAYKYHAKFGVWPQGMRGVGSVEPDKGFHNWCTYQRIKYAKSKSAGGAHA